MEVFKVPLQCILDISNIRHQFTSLKSRIALQVARKIALCNRDFNGVFSFLISCFILEWLRFFETCKLGVSHVIYSRTIIKKKIIFFRCLFSHRYTVWRDNVVRTKMWPTSRLGDWVTDVLTALWRLPCICNWTDSGKMLSTCFI